MYVCASREASGLRQSRVCLARGVCWPVLLPDLPFLTCLSMSTLESVTYLPEKGLYCQRLPSSRIHGGTEPLKGKNPENMGFYGTLKMIFYKVSNLFSCLCGVIASVCVPGCQGNREHQRWLQYPLILVLAGCSGLEPRCKQIMGRQRVLEGELSVQEEKGHFQLRHLHQRCIQT